MTLTINIGVYAVGTVVALVVLSMNEKHRIDEILTAAIKANAMTPMEACLQCLSAGSGFVTLLQRANRKHWSASLQCLSAGSGFVTCKTVLRFEKRKRVSNAFRQVVGL